MIYPKIILFASSRNDLTGLIILINILNKVICGKNFKNLTIGGCTTFLRHLFSFLYTPIYILRLINTSNTLRSRDLTYPFLFQLQRVYKRYENIIQTFSEILTFSYKEEELFTISYASLYLHFQVFSFFFFFLRRHDQLLVRRHL